MTIKYSYFSCMTKCLRSEHGGSNNTQYFSSLQQFQLLIIMCQCKNVIHIKHKQAWLIRWLHIQSLFYILLLETHLCIRIIILYFETLPSIYERTKIWQLIEILSDMEINTCIAICTAFCIIKILLQLMSLGPNHQKHNRIYSIYSKSTGSHLLLRVYTVAWFELFTKFVFVPWTLWYMLIRFWSLFFYG